MAQLIFLIISLGVGVYCFGAAAAARKGKIFAAWQDANCKYMHAHIMYIPLTTTNSLYSIAIYAISINFALWIGNVKSDSPSELYKDS